MRSCFNQDTLEFVEGPTEEMVDQDSRNISMSEEGDFLHFPLVQVSKEFFDSNLSILETLTAWESNFIWLPLYPAP